jgi:Tfp pilus assembly protein PilP
MLMLVGLVLVGCGDDEGSSSAPKAAAKPAGGGAAKKKGEVKLLTPMPHVEDRVSCPTPPSTKKCNPKAPTCDKGEYCLEAGNGDFCGPCPEREGIRHTFAARDFLPTATGLENRDPFQSFVVVQPGLAPEPDSAAAKVQAPQCTQQKQFQAASYSVQDLDLVGIVAQGTQRKVLLLDSTNYGYIVHKGDCVGKEKAFVKEIGSNFVTFQLSPDPTNPNQREPTEISKTLYTDSLSLTMQQQRDADKQPAGNSGPVIAPPPTVGPSAPAPTVGPDPASAVPAPPSQ